MTKTFKRNVTVTHFPQTTLIGLSLDLILRQSIGLSTVGTSSSHVATTSYENVPEPNHKQETRQEEMCAANTNSNYNNTDSVTNQIRNHHIKKKSRCQHSSVVAEDCSR